MPRAAEFKACYAAACERGVQLVDKDIRCLYAQARAAAQRSGVIVEIGSYEGGSTALLAMACPEKRIYAFDACGHRRRTDLWAEYTNPLHVIPATRLSAAMRPYSNVVVTIGIFPDTIGALPEGEPVALLVTDTTSYQGTWDPLTLLLDRLAPGGVMLVHDYARLVGVQRAVDRFMTLHHECAAQAAGAGYVAIRKLDAAGGARYERAFGKLSTPRSLAWPT